MLTNKTCLLVAHGCSLEELENCIEEFRNLDVVWCSMSSFDIEETYILSKIDKHFNIIFDSSTVQFARDYELKVRVPRLSAYLDRKEDNKYICTKTDRANLHDLRNSLGLDFNRKYNKKIIYTEDLNINPSAFCVSLHLFIACLYKLHAKQVILLGADGGGKWGNSVESYYKPDLVKADKIACGNLEYNMTGDTNNINGCYVNLMQQSLGYVPNVLNCSDTSTYTVFPKISYDQLLKELK
jgi:hypothetical protein